MTTLDPSVQIASSGIFGVGLQAAKGVPRSQNAQFAYFPSTALGYGLNQGQAALPPEIGKSITTRGMYKTGITGDGQVNLVPRLVDKFGKLMLMLFGADTVSTGTDITGAAIAGVNTHTFAFDTNEAFIPYATTRRVIPGPRKLAEVTQDVRVARGEISIPAVGPITASLTMAGRIPNGATMFVNDPDTPMALSSITYESDDSFANAVDPSSSVTIMGVAQRCSGLSISVMNELAPADQMRNVGSQTAFDYPVLSRAVSIRATVMFTDKDLYQTLLAGAAADGTTWSSTPLSGDIDFRVFSPDLITGSTKRAIQFRTTNGNIKWGLEGPLNLQPRQMMTLNLIGTFVRQTAGNFFECRIQNGIAIPYSQYIQPTPNTSATSFTVTTNIIAGTGFPTTVGSRVLVVGAKTAANNGVKTLDTGTTGTALKTVEALANETVSPAGSVLVFKVPTVASITSPAGVTSVTSFTASSKTIAGTGLPTTAGAKITVTGAAQAGNNGVFTIAGGSTDTALVVVESLTDETVSPAGSVTVHIANTIIGTNLDVFSVGDKVVISGATNSANNGVFTVATGSTATLLMLEETTLVYEVPATPATITIVA